ncbi:MAG TPA: anthranilate synthase component I family protein [Polyangiaceae bacterium]|nr:anthranilate synthase component I family protein [Polyangiaceae bacterium]
MTVRRLLRVAPDPLSIARSLAGAPGLALLVSRPQGASTSADARWSFVAAWPVQTSVDLVPPSDDAGDPAPRWIGWVPYDALRSAERPGWTRDPDERAAPALVLPAWRRYAAVVRVDHFTGEVLVVGDDEPAVASLARAVLRGAGRHAAASAGRPQLRVLPPDEPEQRHADRVRDVLRLIAAGDVYEVNLARRIPVSFRGDGVALFASLLEAAPAPWSFFQDVGETRVVATSPELALSVRGDVLRTGPIKGTRPRGAHADEDARLARELDDDPKERAELTMAVDVHRNDLGRVAVPGSVRLVAEPRVVAGRTVWSRVAEIVARRAPGASLADVARAVLPCGSVTGAPKVRAMEVIARLEPWRRGLYTGAFGYVGRDGRLELAMAIRTLQLQGDEGAYFTGGGIVADSVPERELEETRWKAAQLARLA